MAVRCTRSCPKGGAIRLAYCWSHARRLFFELAAASPAAVEALAHIAVLYRMEAELGGRSANERHAVRHERSQLT
ncbi:transposase [Methylobacterium sp. HMF5984]|uniref:IS66 family transposase n=1 Tax=Methylobacterium sp. HMF5984 TaxID=3367370 RepID=UPI0038529135